MRDTMRDNTMNTTRFTNCAICDRPKFARGLCKSHYQSYYLNRDKFDSVEDFIETWEPRVRYNHCDICGRSHYAKGLCQAHYQTYRNNRHLYGSIEDFVENWVPRRRGRCQSYCPQGCPSQQADINKLVQKLRAFVDVLENSLCY